MHGNGFAVGMSLAFHGAIESNSPNVAFSPDSNDTSTRCVLHTIMMILHYIQQVDKHGEWRIPSLMAGIRQLRCCTCVGFDSYKRGEIDQVPAQSYSPKRLSGGKN